MDIVHSIPTMLEEAFKFVVFGVGVGYIGRKIVADFLIRQGRKLIASSERNSAIWMHYQKQAVGQGHAPASVLDCSEEKCRVFGSSTQMA